MWQELHADMCRADHNPGREGEGPVQELGKRAEPPHAQARGHHHATQDIGAIRAQGAPKWTVKRPAW